MTCKNETTFWQLNSSHTYYKFIFAQFKFRNPQSQFKIITKHNLNTRPGTRKPLEAKIKRLSMIMPRQFLKICNKWPAIRPSCTYMPWRRSSAPWWVKVSCWFRASFWPQSTIKRRRRKKFMQSPKLAHRNRSGLQHETGGQKPAFRGRSGGVIDTLCGIRFASRKREYQWPRELSFISTRKVIRRGRAKKNRKPVRHCLFFVLVEKKAEEDLKVIENDILQIITLCLD